MNDERISVQGCRHTTVQKLYSEHGVQVLNVEMEPGGEIPLHAHECAATMVITKGRARTLGKDGRVVAAGDVVAKAPNEPHGFTQIEERFCFVSISDGGGIVRRDGWDLRYI